jgi:hypothetical protein
MSMCWAVSVTALATFGLRGTALFLVGGGVVVVFAFAGFRSVRRVAGDGQSRGHAGAGADGGWGVGSGDASNIGFLGLVVYDGMLGCGVDF